MSEESRDWAFLLPELIHLISQKLPDVTDFVRFRAVCKSWSSSAPLSNPPPQSPWLLECNKSADCPPTPLKDNLRFYSLSTKTTGSIPLKQSHKVSFYHGPCSSYLFTLSSDGSLLLWNPLSNAEISVPLPCRLACVIPVWIGSDQILNQRIYFGTVVHNKPCLAVYHPLNRKWNIMKASLCSICYSDGMFFTRNRETVTKVLDGNLQNLLYKIPPPLYLHARRPLVYHVEVSGEVMRVHYYYYQLFLSDNKYKFPFHLYKLNRENSNGKPCWVKVSDIGNHMVFLEIRNGFSLKGPIAGFNGNCIYFLSLPCGAPFKYDIATDTIERLPCPFSACTWFVPSVS